MLADLARDHLPDFMQRPGPKGLLLWQVLSLPVILFISWILGRTAGYLLRRLATRATRFTTSNLDDQIVERISKPANLALTVLVAHALVPILDLTSSAYDAVGHFLGVFLVFSLFWSAYRLVDIGQLAIVNSGWFVKTANNVGLLALSMRFVKVLVSVLGLVAMLQELGYQVTGIIAGLGIGGLAVALAAQKTLEHVLGSVMLSLDQPFHVGDVIKFEDVTGEVEAIGLRSTRIRTPERTIVSIPNGKLADMRIEAISSRDRIRLATLFTLQPNTSSTQLVQIVDELKRAARGEPLVTNDSVQVWVKELSQTAAVIELICAFETTSFAEFASHRERLLLEALRIVEKVGAKWCTPPAIAAV